MDYTNTFQKNNKKMGVTVLIFFQEGQIYPQPHRFRA